MSVYYETRSTHRLTRPSAAMAYQVVRAMCALDEAQIRDDVACNARARQFSAMLYCMIDERTN